MDRGGDGCRADAGSPDADSAGSDGLPDGVTEWIGEVVGGRVTHVERRIHPRPMWFVTVAGATGEPVEVFVLVQVLAVLAADHADRGRLDAEERDDLGTTLLGRPVARIEDGLSTLDAALAPPPDDRLDDAAVLRYLCRRAHRLAWRFRPIMGDFADNGFSPIS